MPMVEREIELLFDQRLEDIARELEERAGNLHYQRAWKFAAELIRKRKQGHIKQVVSA